MWPDTRCDATGTTALLEIDRRDLRAATKMLHASGYRLGTVVATDHDATLSLRYCFYGIATPGWVHVLICVDPQERVAPSITPDIIAADWFEREIEDLYTIRFSQHPRLGDFVFHDVNADRSWAPLRVLRDDGAFAMPVGPIFSGDAESVLYVLETVGEDVVRAVPRLFYKYRGIEKLAQGKSVNDALLLTERTCGTSAIGNGWAFCRAVESACSCTVTPHADALRAYFAELERVRHHMTTIRQICASTAQTVAASQALWFEEQLLRICGKLSGHRYLFGVLAMGGTARDFTRGELLEAIDEIESLRGPIQSLSEGLAGSASFLDRIEHVGIVSEDAASAFELLGPLARASNVCADMRKIQPYGPYAEQHFDVPSEMQGDGYARLRVLFKELSISTQLARDIASSLPPGDARSALRPAAGAALGWTEAPRGASVHWVELTADGTVARYRTTPASFRNWHGFHVATERFSFQDFPIILSTLDLSVAENDR